MYFYIHFFQALAENAWNSPKTSHTRNKIAHTLIFCSDTSSSILLANCPSPPPPSSYITCSTWRCTASSSVRQRNLLSLPHFSIKSPLFWPRSTLLRSRRDRTKRRGRNRPTSPIWGSGSWTTRSTGIWTGRGLKDPRGRRIFLRLRRALVRLHTCPFFIQCQYELSS